MADKKKLTIGALLVTLFATGAIIAVFPMFGVLMDCDEDDCKFKVKDGRYWRVSGVELNELREGTSKLNRKASLITISNNFEENATSGTFIRETPYKNGILIRDTVHFEGDIAKVDLFPFYHKVEIYNASGLSYDWVVDDIKYSGESKSFKDYETKVSFGYDMTATWQEGFHFAKIYKTGSLRVRYKLKSDYEVFQVRLFDPPALNWSAFVPCYNTTRAYNTIVNNYSQLQNNTYFDNITNQSVTDEITFNWTSTDREYYNLADSGCLEEGVTYNSTLHLYKQNDRACVREDNTVCCWLYVDGGVNVQNKKIKNVVTDDDSESGVCVDLDNELVSTSQSNGVLFT